ncbi:TM0996/MTH895 family glutaredoxin-like protein [candidate division KSB1 bacterium]|nr:TM0996/MTH895 family glutaredoxin-like protein [candidate division KSB1 bacterium]
MIIKILGTGCPKCKKLEESAIKAIENSGIDATVEKVKSINDIMNYGVMITPALVIDEKVVSTGKVLSTDEIEKLINVN